MTGRLVAATSVIAMAAVAASVASATIGKECLANPVRNGKVKVGPFTGEIVPEYDIVDGRFRLHVGFYRDRTTGLSQKIPWFVKYDDRAQVGNTLVITGTRRFPTPARTFKQKFYGAGGGKAVFPSSLAPPASGCWRLRFKSGRASPSMTVLVRN